MSWSEQWRETNENRRAAHGVVIKLHERMQTLGTEQQSQELTSVRKLHACFGSTIVGSMLVFTGTSLLGLPLFKRIGVSPVRRVLLSSVAGIIGGSWLLARQSEECQREFFVHGDDSGADIGRQWLRELRPLHPYLANHPAADITLNDPDTDVDVDISRSQ